MKSTLLAVLFAVASVPSLALYNVGDKPKNYCWKDINDTSICLDDITQVRVLLYNAGWCGPCNSEFQDFVKETAEFNGKPVTFISLSSEGWGSGSAPNKKFLTEWQTKHRLDNALANLVVAGSPRDAGKDFFSDVRIPNVVIVDDSGDVAYKAINPGLTEVARQVRKLLPSTLPVPVKY